MLSTTAYLVRGLQVLLGTTKRALVERAEETELNSARIPLSERDRNEAMGSARVAMDDVNILPALPSPTQDPYHIRDTHGGVARISQEAVQEAPSRMHLHQDAIPLTQAQIWATWMIMRSSALTYSAIFIVQPACRLNGNASCTRS